MKKVLLILGFWILNLAHPSLSLADCRPVVTGYCSGRAICTTNGSLCCSNSTECPQPAASAAPATATSSTSALCGTGNLGVNTAIGCLMAGSPKLLIIQLLPWAISIGGGIAFLFIVFAGFQMITAGGDPKKVQAAREILTSAISGLILIVFSLVLLNFIGVSVLNLPGFVGNSDLELIDADITSGP